MRRVALAPDYRVPPVIIGGWQFSAGHSGTAVERDQLFRRWERMVEQGLDTFDCADIYTGVETLIGDFMRATGRRVQVHTKFVPDRSALAAIDKPYVERIVDRSLARLGVERLDLVQFHWWDYGVPGMVETAGWLDELRRAGKIRLLGVTNMDTERLRVLLDAGVPVASIQVQYSVLDRRPAAGMAALCLERGVSLLCYGTVAGGFLAETWRGAPDPVAQDNRSLVKYRLIIEECGGWPAFQRLLEGLAEVAGRHRASLSAVATRWTLDQAAVVAAIVGMRSDQSVASALRVLDLELDQHDRETIAAVLPPAPPGDVYDLERVPGGAHAAIMRYELNKGA